MVEPQPATTVMVIRDGIDTVGLEVFLVKRHRRSGFLPNAWVFPGGRVDPGDLLENHERVGGGEALVAQTQLSRSLLLGFVLAGVRETYEESGIWLGKGQPDATMRDQLNAGNVDISDVLACSDVSVDLNQFGCWSWWVTPEAEKRRYDTRFFVASTETTGGHHDAKETVDSGWFSPGHVLEQATTGVMMLAPPTWWSLRELSRYSKVSEVMEVARVRSIPPIQPVMIFDEDGLRIEFPEKSRSQEGPGEGLPKMIGFLGGQWVVSESE